MVYEVFFLMKEKRRKKEQRRKKTIVQMRKQIELESEKMQVVNKVDGKKNEKIFVGKQIARGIYFGELL